MKALFNIETTGDIQNSKANEMYRTFVKAFTNENKKSDVADLEQELDMYCNFDRIAQLEKTNNSWIVSNLDGDVNFSMIITIK